MMASSQRDLLSRFYARLVVRFLTVDVVGLSSSCFSYSDHVFIVCYGTSNLW